jgi:hypothetical protein
MLPRRETILDLAQPKVQVVQDEPAAGSDEAPDQLEGQGVRLPFVGTVYETEIDAIAPPGNRPDSSASARTQL